MDNSCAPIIITVYNRLNHLKKCIDSIKKNRLAIQTDVFIVSDAPSLQNHVEKINEIRSYVKNIDGFKSVTLIAWQINKGSSRSLFDALKIILEKFDKFIFIEDDNIVSPYFLSYFQDAFEKYRKESSIFGICAYNYMINIPIEYQYDAYFMRVAPMWGFGTWKSKFEEFLKQNQNPDFKSKEYKKYSKYLQQSSFYLKRMVNNNEFWFDAVCTYYLYKNNMFNLLPVQTLVRNTGFDNSGEHCKQNDSFGTQKVFQNSIEKFPIELIINPKMEQLIVDFFAYSILKKIKASTFDSIKFFKKKLKKIYTIN